MFLRCFRGFAPASLALVAFAVTGLAQTKVGVVDLQRAVLSAAEIKKASADMEAKYKPRQAAIEKLQKELQDLEQKLKVEGSKLTPQAASDLNAQGVRKQRDIQRMSEDLQGEVNVERQEILGRSTQRMQEVIRKLAEEKTLDMVVDVNNTLFARPTLDITTEAIAAYDKAYPPK